MDAGKDANVETCSSPLLFEDSQNDNVSMEVNDQSMNGSTIAMNDSKETNLEALFDTNTEADASPPRPHLNLFGSQQQFMANTPATQPSPLRGSPVSKTLSLTKRVQTKPLDISSTKGTESPHTETVAISFGSVSSVEPSTPKTPNILGSKRKIIEDHSSDSEVEVIGSKEPDKTPDEVIRKRPRQSVEVLYQSTPHRASSSPFRAVDISDESLTLKTIPEEPDTADISLHFSPSQDTAPLLDSQPKTYDDKPQSSSSDENNIFAQVDKLKQNSSPEEIEEDANNSVTITDEKKRDSDVKDNATADTLSLENSSQGSTLSQKHSPPLDNPLPGDGTKSSNWEEGFILSKIKYKKGDDDTLEAVKVEWHVGVTTEFGLESSSSVRSSMSPGSVSSGDSKLPFPLPGMRQSIASSNSSSSSSSIFLKPPAGKIAQTGALKFLHRSIVHSKDPKFNATEAFAKLKVPNCTDQGSQTETNQDEESTPLVTARSMLDTPSTKKHNSRAARTSQRGRRNSKSETRKLSLKTGQKKRKFSGSASAQASPEPLPVTPSNSQESTNVSSKKTSIATEVMLGEIGDENQPKQGIGTPVFAKWTDDKFYPGKTVSYETGRWEILFDDGQRRSVLPENIVKVDSLHVGQPIHAAVTKTGDYYPGIIINVVDSNNVSKYKVEIHEKGEFTVSKQDLCLNEDQVRYLRENMSDSSFCLASPAQKPDVTLDNLMDGKRSRSKRQLSVPSSSSVGKPSAVVPKSPVSSRRALSLTESPACRGRGRPRLDQPGCSGNQAKVEKVTSESESQLEGEVDWLSQWENLPGLDDSTLPEPTFTGNKDKDKEKEVLGPYPKKKIFKGYYFCLVYCPGQDSESQSEMDSEMESQDPIPDREILVHPFNKIYMEQQLRKGGGTVVEFFEPYQLEQDRANCLMISNRSNTSAKSVMCLALGIQTVKHTWVAMCCKNDKMMPPKNYYLPAGYSTHLNKKVEWNEHPKDKKMLDKYKIALVSNIDQPFFEFWKKILKQTKAKIVAAERCEDFLMRDKNLLRSEVDVAVTDDECPEELLNWTKNLSIPLVQTSWIIQCLINGKLVPMDRHLKVIDKQPLSSLMQSQSQEY